MLSDHTTGYLGPGWYKLRVIKSKPFTTHKGTEAVEFTCRCDEVGKLAKVSFFFSEHATWRLTEFAIVCGVSTSELHQYNELRPEHHDKYIVNRVGSDGKKGPLVWCEVCKERGSKFHRIEKFKHENQPPTDAEIKSTEARNIMLSEAKAAQDIAAQATPPPMMTAAEANSVDPPAIPDDEIPF